MGNVETKQPLGFIWPTEDPFLMCVHHDDHYPAGNEVLGPATSLKGRQLGNDLEKCDGFRMYYGAEVPGFPRHPHRGFETVTLVRQGWVDHSDSLGAAARYGAGDVQWLTAGAGVEHAEMFPLLNRNKGNPLELFQIWLNLPSTHKMVSPHFGMMWSDEVGQYRHVDSSGNLTDIAIVTGALEGQEPLSPPPDSWARDPAHDVAIWTLRLEPGAEFTLPPARPGTVRNIYIHQGHGVRSANEQLQSGHRFRIRADVRFPLTNRDAVSEMVMLQGRPIGETVAARGPFVMNTEDELVRAFSEFRQMQYGNWPWKRSDPVHGDEGLFARYPDGRVSHPG